MKVGRKKQIYMKKLIIFAFVGFVFVTGFALIPSAHAAETVVQNAEISPADAKILKQALDVLGLVLKDIEGRTIRNEFSVERKVVIQESLAVVESRLVGINGLVKNYGVAINYPGLGSLYAEGANQVVDETVKKNDSTEPIYSKSGLASLWATVWPGKFIVVVLMLAAAAAIAFNFRKKKEIVT